MSCGIIPLCIVLCRSKNSETTKHVKVYQVILLVSTYRHLYCEENYVGMRWLKCDGHCYQNMDNVLSLQSLHFRNPATDLQSKILFIMFS